MTALVTGGCGFIGGAIVRRLVAQGIRVVNLDKLTYAAMPEALGHLPNDRYRLVVGDICDRALLDGIFEAHQPDFVIHAAAETHVDRSIDGPAEFIDSNVTGTFRMLEAARSHWAGRKGDFRFLHISTDEVYGSLDAMAPPFTESSPYAPNSPYAASKASADHLVRAWGETYGLPVLTTNCSNNYGPWQFPEKLIPLMILNGIENREMPVYGNGRNIRDWLHVEDHADAVWAVLNKSAPGRTYNIGGNSELENISVVRRICDRLDERLPGCGGRRHLIRHVADRAGHDARYAIDAGLIRRELGWMPSQSFERGLASTVDWYIENTEWWKQIRTKSYDGHRLGTGNPATSPTDEQMAAVSN